MSTLKSQTSLLVSVNNTVTDYMKQLTEESV